MLKEYIYLKKWRSISLQGALISLPTSSALADLGVCPAHISRFVTSLCGWKLFSGSTLPVEGGLDSVALLSCFLWVGFQPVFSVPGYLCTAECVQSLLPRLAQHFPNPAPSPQSPSPLTQAYPSVLAKCYSFLKLSQSTISFWIVLTHSHCYLMVQISLIINTSHVAVYCCCCFASYFFFLFTSLKFPSPTGLQIHWW